MDRAAEAAESEGLKEGFRRISGGWSSVNAAERPYFAGRNGCWSCRELLLGELDFVDRSGEFKSVGSKLSGDHTTSDSINSIGFESESGCLSRSRNRMDEDDDDDVLSLSIDSNPPLHFF